MALNREFATGTERYSVLVEFRSDVAAAGRTTTTSRPDALRAATGRECRRVGGLPPQRPGGARPASLTADRDQGEFDRFFEVDADSRDQAIDLSGKVLKALKDDVLQALPVPPAEPALGPPSAEPTTLDSLTPDFRRLQGYLDAAPNGIDASFAWQFPGGDGSGVRVVDFEGGWRFEHECLSAIRFNQWGGLPRSTSGWIEHGTAVASLLGSSNDQKGIVGICPGATIGVASAFGGTNDTQRVATNLLALLEILRPGDVVLVELQRPGPFANFAPNTEQQGYLPVSYWADVRTAMSILTASGITVVEVAGNGSQNLDDTAAYGNAFDQKQNDSGGIMVGAGAPPNGQFGQARSRLAFSNYGNRLDCQSWGESVISAGYGDLWGASNLDRSYTGHFMGTSSAGPLVAGAVACLQGRHRQVFGAPLNPLVIRQALASVGTPQAFSEKGSDRIGPQPDLRLLFGLFGLS